MRLLSMSGFVPEQICDVVRFTGYRGEQTISHYCGYANDFISQVKNDVKIDGAVFPRSCDSSRIMKSYLEDSGKFLYQIHVPARSDEMAVDFFTRELGNYKQALETWFNTELSDLEQRIKLVNIRNARIAEAYRSLEELSYGDYLRDIHTCLQKPLEEQNINIRGGKRTGGRKRIYLAGSFLANEKIADAIEECGLKIVGDDLPESGRLQGNLVQSNTGDPVRAIAESILHQRKSPTQDEFYPIMEQDVKQIRDLHADGVVFVTQKYCEPYDYFYSVLKKRLDREDIPAVRIQISNSEDDRKVRLIVEAFADMI